MSKIAPNRDITQGRLLRSITDNLSGEGTRFAFLLGAGASRSSGIGSAAELASKWVKQLKADDPEVLRKLKISEDDDASKMAQAYSAIYQARFGHQPADGYQELENIITAPDVEPSLGYIMLASLMLETANNLVLTVNFDRLTETALLTVFNHHAKVVFHENMLPIIRLPDRQPTVVKIHNDVFFQPMSESKNISALSDAWKKKIDEILATYHLIVLGYGGNDREGLMQHLVDNAVPKRVYWCYRQEDDIPEVVIKQKYYCVRVDGFDEFMYALNEKLPQAKASNLETIKERIQKAAGAKVKRLDERVNTISEQNKGTESKPALAKIQNFVANTWWDVELKVRDTTDTDTKDALYQEGIRKFPKSAELMESYAIFLKNIHRKYGQAEYYYKKALELDPNDALYNGNYAIFLKNIRQDYDQAERYYKKALELNPNDANTNCNYGLFLHEIRRNYKKAERHYKIALELNPNHVNTNGNYASFLTHIRKDHYQAERYYKKALELDPNNADTNGNYASFLKNISKNYDQAEQYYKKALELDSNHANNNGNYANFLAGIRKDHGQAEHYYKKALELDPDHDIANGNYAGFLLAQGRKQEALAYLEKAEKLSDRRDLDLDLTFYRLAHFPNSSTESKTRILKLLAEGVRLIHSDFSANIDRAEQDGCEYVDELRELAARITTAE